MNHHTVFGDLRQRATVVYRVTTQASTYLVGFHELRGRKFVVVRGEPGTDREHVVVRDSDPRVGEHSMFELPIAEWPGKSFEVAMMTSSMIEAVVAEHDPRAIAAVGVDAHAARSPWARPPDLVHPPTAPSGLPAPPGMSDAPRIVPMASRGTRPVDAGASIADAARQVVVGQAPAPEPELPYPQRHVRYAESVVLLLRSIARRDRLFDDLLAERRELRDLLRSSLDEAAILLEQIRRRDRK